MSLLSKGQCHEIFYLLSFAKTTLPGTYMNRLKRFRELFCFREDYKIRKLRVRVQTFFLTLGFRLLKILLLDS